MSDIYRFGIDRVFGTEQIKYLFDAKLENDIRPTRSHCGIYIVTQL